MKGQLPLGDSTPRKNFPYVTISLIVINVIVFIWSLSDFDNIINTYGFTPLYPSILTLFTSMFLHGGIEHLAGNMWYLWIFGDNVEDALGKAKYTVLYFLSGLAADFFQYITDPTSNVPSIGASGAISGILGSYIVLFPNTKVYVGGESGIWPVPAWLMIGLWFALQLFLALIGGGGDVAVWAHVGGFAFGYVFTKIWLREQK